MSLTLTDTLPRVERFRRPDELEAATLASRPSRFPRGPRVPPTNMEVCRMKPGLAYYLAVSRPSEPVTRWSPDGPARSRAHDRPAGPIRWTKKLFAAIPGV